MGITIAGIIPLICIITLVVVIALYFNRKRKIRENLENSKLGLPPKHNLNHVEIRIDYILLVAALVIAVAYCVNLQNKVDEMSKDIEQHAINCENNQHVILNKIYDIEHPDVEENIDSQFSSFSLKLISIDNDLNASFELKAIPKETSDDSTIDLLLFGTVVEGISKSGSIFETVISINLQDKTIKNSEEEIVVSLKQNGVAKNESIPVYALSEFLDEIRIGVYKLEHQDDVTDPGKYNFYYQLENDMKDVATLYVRFSDGSDITKETKAHAGDNTITLEDQRFTEQMFSEYRVTCEGNNGLMYTVFNKMYSYGYEIANGKGHKVVLEGF